MATYTVTLNTRATASHREEEISSSLSLASGVAAVSDTTGPLDDSSNYSVVNTTLAAGSSAQSLIAAMITPALLILASGSLIATSLARLGRIMGRIRKVSESEALLLSAAELDRERLRAGYANRAITILFVAVSLFVIAGIAISVDRLSGGHMEWLPVTITLIGMLLIVAAGYHDGSGVAIVFASNL